MAVIVKLGQNDPKKRPLAKTGASASTPGFRLPFGDGDEWFHDRRIIIGAATGVVVAGLAWGVMAMQSPQGPLAGVKPSAPQAMLSEAEADARNAEAAKAKATLPGGYDADPDNATTAPKVDPRAATADQTPDD